MSQLNYGYIRTGELAHETAGLLCLLRYICACLSCVQVNLLLFRFFMGYLLLHYYCIFVSLDLHGRFGLLLRVGGSWSSSSLLYASCVCSGLG